MPLYSTISVGAGILTFPKYNLPRVHFSLILVWNRRIFSSTKMATWNLLTLECPSPESHLITSELSPPVELQNIPPLKSLKDSDMVELSIGGRLAAPFMKWFIKFLPSTMMTEARCSTKSWMMNQFFQMKLVKAWLT